MGGGRQTSDDGLPGAPLEAENAALRRSLASAEMHMASTLMRATRLAQVISVLGNEKDLETTIERAAVEVGELFFADMALLMLDTDAGLTIAGYWGVSASDIPRVPFALPAVEEATSRTSVSLGPVEDVPVPEWLARYSPRHVAWAELLVGEKSLGWMLLARRGDEPFEDSEATELRAVAYRIALAVENGMLQGQMKDQLAQLHRLQALTTSLAGTLELDAVGGRVAETLVSEAVVSASAVLIDRGGELVVLSSAGRDRDLGCPAPGLPARLDERWARFPLEVAGRTVGVVAVTGAPAAGSEPHELLLHLLSLGALALDKALLYEQTCDQARHDSLTGMLSHRVFQEVLETLIAGADPFSVLLFDIDDFKQVNDLHGHQIGDEALRLVSSTLKQGTRSGDTVFRVGGEEFCAVLPGLGVKDAYAVAEALRLKVSAMVSTLPNPLTVSVGVASFPDHAQERDELYAKADAALYVSKRAGKNRTSIAGGETPKHAAPARREVGLDLLQSKDPSTVNHSVHVAILAVEIARALRIDESRLADLRTAARLHDIGKLAVPAAILNKPGKLDEEEFRIIMIHPLVGAELLKSWGLTGPAKIVLQHHERVDGSGYPAGLRGEEITLESRIIHATDAYLAMTLDRPYRKAMKRDDVFAELERHSGTQFDPDVVVALLAFVRSSATALTDATEPVYVDRSSTQDERLIRA